MSGNLRTLRDAARRAGVLSNVETSGTRTRAGGRERTRRAAACAVVGLTGFALLVPNLQPLSSPRTPPVGVGLSLLSSAVSVGLVAAAAGLYRSEFTTSNAVRVAAWNLLGVAVLGGAMAALASHQRATGALVEPSPFGASSLLAVGAAAHVVIGVYDARRVRAEQLARERRRITVLNRVLRHNLRNDANVLLGHAERLRGGVESADLARSAEVVADRAATLGSLAEGAKQLSRAHEHDPRTNGPVALRPLVSEAVADAGAERDVDHGSVEDLTVEADPTLCRIALARLVENATEHGEPPVRVRTRRRGETVDVEVWDAGPGVPDHERAVVTGGEITQLEHGSGLGLWVAAAAADACGGAVRFGDGDDPTVALRLARAAT